MKKEQAVGLLGMLNVLLKDNEFVFSRAVGLVGYRIDLWSYTYAKAETDHSNTIRLLRAMADALEK